MPDLRAVLLHIDDDANDAFFVKRAIKRLGAPVDYAWVENGASALSYLQELRSEDHPRLILLDIKMPEMNGFEFLEALACLPAFQNIPVIMLSSSSHPLDRERAHELGAKDFLCKTAIPSELGELLAPVLARWCSQDASAPTSH